MITWNEEELLPTAIASTAGLADEVVVVDTGSTDGTVEVALLLGAKVVTGADRYHKGESRNKAVEEASGDWIVILDADERVADPQGVRAFLESTDAQAVYVKLAYVDSEGNHTLSYSQMRCWRRGTYLYKYRAHEVPVPTEGWGKLAHTDFIWEHRPLPDRTWKREYALRRLLLDVEENPSDARPLYYLGREYAYSQKWEKALETLQDYLDSAGQRDRADAWYFMARCHGKLGQPRKQKVALFQACAEQPSRREWWGTLAELYHNEGNDEVAVGLLKCALEQIPSKTSYTNHHWHGPHIYDLLARCLWKLGRYEEGHGYATQAAKLAPTNKRLLDNLGFFERKLGAGRAKGANYYDETFAWITQDPRSMTRMRALNEAVAAEIVGSVLDLGCGVGLLANLVDGKYTGVDFSAYALDYAKANCHNAGAEWLLGDLRELPQMERHDTVTLIEVLEHLEDPAGVARDALALARRRVIVTVPVNMPDPAHVKPSWTEDDIKKLLGEPLICSNIDSHYLMAVRVIR
jgi:tetratricopeptide (TPR) repeat protein